MPTVTVNRTLAAPAEKVWGILRTFRLDYFPGYPHRLDGEGAGARRTFHLPEGEMTELIESLDEASMSLGYTIASGPWPVREYHARIDVHPGEGRTCTVSWSAAFDSVESNPERISQIIESTFKMNLKALDIFLSA